MNHKIHTRQSIDAPPTARELEVIVRRLWTTEPRSSPAERTSLFTELTSIGSALERIILLDETRSARSGIDDDLCSADLAEYERRIRNLLACWPSDVGVPSPPLVAA